MQPVKGRHKPLEVALQAVSGLQEPCVQHVTQIHMPMEGALRVVNLSDGLEKPHMLYVKGRHMPVEGGCGATPANGLEELAGTVLLVAPSVVWGTTAVVALSAPVAMAGICCGYTP